MLAAATGGPGVCRAHGVSRSLAATSRAASGRIESVSFSSGAHTSAGRRPDIVAANWDTFTRSPPSSVASRARVSPASRRASLDPSDRLPSSSSEEEVRRQAQRHVAAQRRRTRCWRPRSETKRARQADQSARATRRGATLASASRASQNADVANPSAPSRAPVTRAEAATRHRAISGSSTRSRRASTCAVASRGRGNSFSTASAPARSLSHRSIDSRRSVHCRGRHRRRATSSS
mmetsp:Transcript_17725/g.55520  ORF Transcript_17725/g.55520 Transcript_17725/m.55520 type:complete len:235 (-) Transcript_17725:430-1134(-)